MDNYEYWSFEKYYFENTLVIFDGYLCMSIIGQGVEPSKIRHTSEIIKPLK